MDRISSEHGTDVNHPKFRTGILNFVRNLFAMTKPIKGITKENVEWVQDAFDSVIEWYEGKRTFAYDELLDIIRRMVSLCEIPPHLRKN